MLLANSFRILLTKFSFEKYYAAFLGKIPRKSWRRFSAHKPSGLLFLGHKQLREHRKKSTYIVRGPHCFCCRLLWALPPLSALQTRSDLCIPRNETARIQAYRNWERGRTVSFLRIFVSNFRYSAVALQCSQLGQESSTRDTEGKKE
jgi:hypothetical protein